MEHRKAGSWHTDNTGAVFMAGHIYIADIGSKTIVISKEEKATDIHASLKIYIEIVNNI